MNIELLDRIKAEIQSRPERFDMLNFVDDEPEWSTGSADDIRKAFTSPDCGTTCCIGGEAVVLSEMDFREFEDSDGDIDVEEAAIAALEITVAEANRLFYLDQWPDDLAVQYMKFYPFDMFAAAKIAAVRIDRFIATDGAE